MHDRKIVFESYNFFRNLSAKLCENGEVLLVGESGLRPTGYYIKYPIIGFNRKIYGFGVVDERVYFVYGDSYIDVTSDEFSSCVKKTGFFSYNFYLFSGDNLVLEVNYIDFLLAETDSVNSNFFVDVAVFLSSPEKKENFVGYWKE